MDQCDIAKTPHSRHSLLRLRFLEHDVSESAPCGIRNESTAFCTRPDKQEEDVRRFSQPLRRVEGAVESMRHSVGAHVSDDEFFRRVPKPRREPNPGDAVRNGKDLHRS